jgi:hypothetical protein
MSAHGLDWRPDYSPELVRRELEMIRDDLAANAVRICGRDPGRLQDATEYALQLGLDVWFCPELWNATAEQTTAYLADVAPVAERLRKRWPEQFTFSVGNEQTFFMKGIVPGRNHAQRTRSVAKVRELTRSGRATPPLRAFLADAAAVVRRSYGGPLSYCALPIEYPDWDLFDVIGVNMYLQGRDVSRYEAHLARLKEHGKPVAITELGYAACRDADNPEFLSRINAQQWSLLPGMRPRVREVHSRDEERQASLTIEQLELLDRNGVDGAFVMSFSFPLMPYDPDPRHDLDATALSLVRTVRHGESEPKKAFRAVAEFYRRQAGAKVTG